MRDDRSLEYHKFGTFSIQDFVRMQSRYPHAFSLVQIYNPKDFPQAISSADEKKSLNVKGMEKSGLKFVESMIDQVM